MRARTRSTSIPAPATTAWSSTAPNDDEQSSISGFGDSVFVLASAFVFIEHAEPTDRLRLNGRGGDDLLSTSTDAMKITLDAGDGGGTLLGGPGDDVLLGGDDFDLVKGGPGDDIVDMGGDFDSFTWRSGDGNDRIDGGSGPRDGMFIFGSDADETIDMRADGHRLRVSGDVSLDIDDIEAFDVLPGSGADLVRIGDLRSAGVIDIHTSLAATLITQFGDNSADRVEIAGADGAAKVTGQGGAATVTGLPREAPALALRRAVRHAGHHRRRRASTAPAWRPARSAWRRTRRRSPWRAPRRPHRAASARRACRAPRRRGGRPCERRPPGARRSRCWSSPR